MHRDGSFNVAYCKTGQCKIESMLNLNEAYVSEVVRVTLGSYVCSQHARIAQVPNTRPATTLQGFHRK